jgi:hypothetical protein
MDIKVSPEASLRSGGTLPDSDEENAYSEEDSGGGENGERPRKRQRRPMSVS